MEFNIDLPKVRQKAIESINSSFSLIQNDSDLSFLLIISCKHRAMSCQNFYVLFIQRWKKSRKKSSRGPMGIKILKLWNLPFQSWFWTSPISSLWIFMPESCSFLLNLKRSTHLKPITSHFFKSSKLKI